MRQIKDDDFAQIEEVADAANTIHDLLQGLADRGEEYANERSDKWHESENGEAYNAWVEQIRDACNAAAELASELESITQRPDVM